MYLLLIILFTIINMAKQNSKVTYRWCFLEKYVESSVCHWFKFFSPIYSQFTFYKGIWFIKYHVIVTCNIYYATYSNFIKIIWSKKKRQFWIWKIKTWVLQNSCYQRSLKKKLEKHLKRKIINLIFLVQI